MMAMPLAAVLMLVLFFGRETLYSWSHPGALANAPAIAGKVRYLQMPWMFVRVTGSLVLWGAFAWLFRRTSLETARHPKHHLALHPRPTPYPPSFVPPPALPLSLRPHAP